MRILFGRKEDGVKSIPIDEIKECLADNIRDVDRDLQGIDEDERKVLVSMVIDRTEFCFEIGVLTGEERDMAVDYLTSKLSPVDGWWSN